MPLGECSLRNVHCNIVYVPPYIAHTAIRARRKRNLRSVRHMEADSLPPGYKHFVTLDQNSSRGKHWWSRPAVEERCGGVVATNEDIVVASTQVAPPLVETSSTPPSNRFSRSKYARR